MQVAGTNNSDADSVALLRHFGQKSADAVTRMVDADWGCFYFLDRDLNFHSFSVVGAPSELRAAYLENDLEAADPLHPRRLISPRCSFTTVAEPGRRVICKEDSRFWSVFRSFGVRRIGEMIFWESGRPVAGLSLVWRTAPSSSSFDRGFGVQSYVEFNLGVLLHESPRAHGNRPSAIDKLSSREIEVATLACRGHTSARIARDLHIGLATVKTHLLHIFAKTGVNSRTELAALLLRSS